MMLMSRQFPGTEAPPSPPSFLDSSPYTPVPFLNHRATLLALMISFMVFSWICCLLRLYTRFVILRVPGWDDVFIILTMLSTAVGSIVLCILPDLGLGRSIYTMNTFEFERFMRIFYIGNAMYPVAVTVIKLALLFQYLRVFEVGSRTRVFCKFMIALTTVWGLTFIALRWVPCYPVAAYWKPSIQGARCWGFNAQDPRAFMRLFVSQATSTAVLDLIVFAIPIQLCFRPDTPRNTKLCLLGLLVLGSMSISCAIGRMVFVILRFTSDDFRADPSWYGATTAGLACLEVHLAAACAALPVFWPVLKTTWGRIDVTTEVSVTREFGRFHPKTHANTDVELHSASSTRNLTLDNHEPEVPGTWEPFVGNETTGVGENTTVVEAPAAGKKG